MDILVEIFITRGKKNWHLQSLITYKMFGLRKPNIWFAHNFESTLPTFFSNRKVQLLITDDRIINSLRQRLLSVSLATCVCRGTGWSALR